VGVRIASSKVKIISILLILSLSTSISAKEIQVVDKSYMPKAKSMLSKLGTKKNRTSNAYTYGNKQINSMEERMVNASSKLR
jgi:hypothetical protein